MSGTNYIRPVHIKDLVLRDYTSLMLFCKRHGILRLKLGDFEVEFGETQVLPKKQIKSKVHDKNNEEALLEEEADIKNRQVDEALVIDPSLAESLILEGKLKNG